MVTAPQRLNIGHLAFAILPPLFWAGNFFLARAFRDDIPPFQMSFWRWLIAFFLLLPFVLPKLRQNRDRLRREWLWLSALGIVGVTAFNCFIYVALHHTTVVNAALINSLMPVMTLVFAYIFLRVRIAGLQVLGVALALTGAVVIIARGNVHILSALAPQYGDILVFLGMSAWALYTVLIRWKPTALDPLVFLLTTIGFGVLGHMPIAVWEAAVVGTMTVSAGSLLALVYFAIFPSLLAYIFWNRAVRSIGPARASLFMYLMPLFAAGLAIIFLNESLQAYHVFGMAIIVAGLTMSMRASAPAPGKDLPDRQPQRG